MCSGTCLLAYAIMLTLTETICSQVKADIGSTSCICWCLAAVTLAWSACNLAVATLMQSCLVERAPFVWWMLKLFRLLGRTLEQDDQAGRACNCSGVAT